MRYYLYICWITCNNKNTFLKWIVSGSVDYTGSSGSTGSNGPTIQLHDVIIGYECIMYLQ